MGDMFDPPEAVKKVAVIGGGPAGMKAALTAAERGHQVTLFEAQDHLGGQLIHADYMSFKVPLRQYKKYLIRQVGKAGVDVHLNTRATREMLAAGGYDAVIAACGAVPRKLDIPGVSQENVYAPIDIFGHEDALGQRVLVVGGGETGAETAAHLRNMGKDVTVMTRQKRICDNYESHAERVFRELLEGIPVIPHAQITKIEGNIITYIDESGTEQTSKADSVVMASGVLANVDECMKFADTAPQFFVVGDSDVKVCELFNLHFIGPKGLNDGKLKTYEPNVRHATFTAYTTAMQI